MKSIFVFADSFSTNMILFNIDYILDQKIEYICLLSENHNQDDPCLTNGKIPVKLFKTAKECIDESDMVLILKSYNTPLKSIGNILEYAKIQCKESIVIDNPWSEEVQNIDIGSCCSFDDMRIKPVILLLSCGKASQLYCVESLLNRIFEENKISISQYFSKETSDFLNQLDSRGCLNKSIHKQLSKTDFSSVIVLSYRVCNVNHLFQCVELVRAINPDLLIVQTDRSIREEEYDEIRNITRYSCKREVDKFIVMNYIYLDSLFNAYLKNETKNNGCICIEDTNIKEVISKLIFRKLTFPRNIKEV